MKNITKKAALWVAEQRYTPFRFRRSMIKRLHPSILQDHEFEMDFYGYTYHGNMRDYINRNIFLCGAHEKYMLHFLRDYVKENKLQDTSYIDIGSNVGNHALFMSTLVKKVYAFEPYIVVRAQLERTIEENKIQNIELYPIGLGNKEEKLPFFQPPESNLGAASFNQGSGGSELYIGDLELKTGDSIFLNKLDAISIIKMDIEGHEPYALEGLKETISKHRPLIILELLPSTRARFKSAEEFYALFPENYKFFRFKKASLDSGKYSIAPYVFGKDYKNHDIIAVPDSN